MNQRYSSSTETTGSKYGNEICVRPFTFDFPDDLDPQWVPDNPWRSHFYNGVSLTMPYLEPFLCKTMREAMAQVDDEGLRDDMRGFIGQEAQHYQCHRRLNKVLTNKIPQLVKSEAHIEQSYTRLSTRSLRRRLAYSAGFECMTNGFTNLIVGRRAELFQNAEPHVTSFWIAHMVEETEHKTVAFDVYQYCFGDYWPRAIGVLYGSFGVLHLGLGGMFRALRESGDLFSVRGVLGLVKEASKTLGAILPYLLRAMKPDYDPRDEPEARWAQEWIDGYAQADPEQPMPLVDTKASGIPSPFVAPALTTA